MRKLNGLLFFWVFVTSVIQMEARGAGLEANLKEVESFQFELDQQLNIASEQLFFGPTERDVRILCALICRAQRNYSYQRCMDGWHFIVDVPGCLERARDFFGLPDWPW